MMANGDDVAPAVAAPPNGDKKEYTFRQKSTGQSVTLRASPGTDMARLKARAGEIFAQRATTPALADMPGAFVRGITTGLGGSAPLGQAAQVEMGQVGPGYEPVPGSKETRQILEKEFLPAGLAHEPVTTAGRGAEKFGEFVGDPATWIGPGGFFRKALSALTGAIGGTIGERYGGTVGGFIGGAIGGGVGGFGAGGKGLPGRVPGAVRKATTDDALQAAAKEGYQQLEQSPFMATTMQAGTIKTAIENQLRADNFPDWLVGKTYRALEHLNEPSSHMPSIRAPGLITVGEVERVRQVLGKLRIEGGNEAQAASTAIEAIDDYLMNLPGVGEAAIKARKNWAAYKRGQMIEEAITRGIGRAKVSGTGANTDNTIKQEFEKLKKKPYYEKSFTPEEREQIDLITDPGVGLDVARWVSRFSPRHLLPSMAALFGLSHLGHVTGAPNEQLNALIMFGSGEAAKQYVVRMTKKRAERLMEATRARSPAGGAAAGLPPGQFYTPRPATPATMRAGYGAARALGATALSPETTERLELPEITVRPQ
jgi:hypothetical protein